jgi:hypothetical protein
MTDAPLTAHFKAMEVFIYERFRQTDTKLDRVLTELADLKPPALRSRSAWVSGMEVQLGQLVTAVGRVNERIDRVELRLERVERRLDLSADVAP